MKILMITPYLPYPLLSGGQVRSYHLIKNLAKKHQISLISLVKSETEKKFVKELEKYCSRVLVFPRPKNPWSLRNILRTGFSANPFLIVRNFSPLAKQAINSLVKVENFDLIHAETFYVMPHLPQTDIPILLVEQTIEYQVYTHYVEILPPYLFFLKPFLYIDVSKLKWWERYYWQKADLVATVSENDLQEIKKLTTNIKVRVVPNGVDYQFFKEHVSDKAPTPMILFVGNFNWLQNREAVEILTKKVWPLIKLKIPDVKLLITGYHSRQFVKTNDNQIEIKTMADIREAYQSAWIFIAPFKSGGGSRLKIFEAMASGLPIVATKKGIEGINAQAGIHFLLGETENELAQKAVLLLQKRSLANKIGLAAKNMVKENYDWQIPAYNLDAVYQEMSK